MELSGNWPSIPPPEKCLVEAGSGAPIPLPMNGELISNPLPNWKKVVFHIPCLSSVNRAEQGTDLYLLHNGSRKYSNSRATVVAAEACSNSGTLLPFSPPQVSTRPSGAQLSFSSQPAAVQRYKSALCFPLPWCQLGMAGSLNQGPTFARKVLVDRDGS